MPAFSVTHVTRALSKRAEVAPPEGDSPLARWGRSTLNIFGNTPNRMQAMFDYSQDQSLPLIARMAGRPDPGFFDKNWFGLGAQGNADTFTRENARALGGQLMGTKGAVPPQGVVSNFGEALKRGHTGTVLGTGATALLAGVLAYNAFKKRNKRPTQG